MLNHSCKCSAKMVVGRSFQRKQVTPMQPAKCSCQCCSQAWQPTSYEASVEVSISCSARSKTTAPGLWKAEACPSSHISIAVFLTEVPSLFLVPQRVGQRLL